LDSGRQPDERESASGAADFGNNPAVQDQLVLELAAHTPPRQPAERKQISHIESVFLEWAMRPPVTGHCA
jgi:hypothetical protein